MELLHVMVGGDKNDFNKAEKIINCYSKKVKLLGPSGSGQLAKNGKPNMYSWFSTKFIRSY